MITQDIEMAPQRTGVIPQRTEMIPHYTEMTPHYTEMIPQLIEMMKQHCASISVIDNLNNSLFILNSQPLKTIQFSDCQLIICDNTCLYLPVCVFLWSKPCIF